MIIEKLKSERNIPEQRIVSYRFDSMLYEDMTAKELYRDISGKLSYDSKTYLFLDEIQEIDGWERIFSKVDIRLFESREEKSFILPIPHSDTVF